MYECMCKTYTKPKKCVINYIFYLPSIEKFEILTIQKYKKCFLPAGPWNSDFDHSGPLKTNFDTWGCEKVIWAGGRRKVNKAGGCRPRKSNTLLWLGWCLVLSSQWVNWILASILEIVFLWDIDFSEHG